MSVDDKEINIMANVSKETQDKVDKVKVEVDKKPKVDKKVEADKQAEADKKAAEAAEAAEDKEILIAAEADKKAAEAAEAAEDKEILVAAKLEKSLAKLEPRRQYFYCTVNHLMAEGEDRNNPIPVNDCGDHKRGRAVCYPNKRCILSLVQINIIREAVEQHDISVPDGSGIYDSTNPLGEAEKQFPEFKARIDRNTGAIMLKKEKARFSIEVHERYIPED